MSMLNNPFKFLDKISRATRCKRYIIVREETIDDSENSEKNEKSILASYWPFDTIHVGRKTFESKGREYIDNLFKK